MLGCDLGGGAISVARTRRRDLADASRVGCDLSGTNSTTRSRRCV